MKYRYFLLLFLLLLVFYSIHGCQFDLNNRESSSSNKIKVEYDYQGLQTDDDRWNISSTENTYGPANVKIEKAPNVQMLTPVVMNLDPNMTECEGYQYLNGFISRDYSINQYPIYLQLATTIEYDGALTPIVGLSVNFRFTNQMECNGVRNYSYLYFGNITFYENGKNYQSLLNKDAAHELLHQVGNVFDDDAHCNHDFDLQPPENCQHCTKCVLWPRIEEGYDFSDLVNTLTEFEICPRHITSLKNGPDIIQENPFTPVVAGSPNSSPCTQPPCGQTPCGQTSFSKTDLKIAFAKKVFRKYEPILVLFEYINNNTDIDTIRQNFIDIFDETGFIIETQNGKIYDTRNDSPLSLTYINAPRFYLQPKDTFIASMTLNYRYGEKINGRENYFDLHGYLGPGKYKVSSYTFINGKKYITNKEDFEVVELTPEDENVLELIKSKNFNELLKTYPENPFVEHSLIRDVGRRHRFYDVNKPFSNDNKPLKSEEVINDWRIFLNSFPDSYYNVEFTVQDPFFGKLALSSEHFLEDIEYIKNLYPGTLLNKLLSQDYYVKQYYDRFINSQKFIKDQEKKNKKN